MSERNSPSGSALAMIASRCLRHRHFIISVAILLSIFVAINLLKGVVKQPVPWPEDMLVDGDFRLLNFSGRFGPYVKVTADGGYYRTAAGEPILDGKQDGELIFERDILRTLGIGTSYDKKRYDNRSSNWYVARIYEDSRVTDPNSPYRFWRMEIYYYTGLKDKVPHVPLRCLEAGGAKVLSHEKVPFTFPTGGEPWNGQIGFQRAHWQRVNPDGSSRQGVEYYVFSLNGQPARKWEYVRFKMALPGPRYNYFAKIQFAPAGYSSFTDLAEADRAAAEFIKYALRAALETLPDAADVERINEKNEDG